MLISYKGYYVELNKIYIFKIKGMICKFCQKVFVHTNIGAKNKHEKGCNNNPDKVIYKSNLIQYHKDVKKGIKLPPWNETNLTKEERIKRSERVKENPNWSKIGKKTSNSTKEILSKKRSEFLETTGKGGFHNIRWYKIKNILSEEYIVRGTWELKVAEWLNANDILWKRKIYLQYEKEGLKRTYTPDFYLPTTNQYIEVKGYFSQLDKEKLNLVQEQNNINLLLWFGKDIKELNTKLALVSPHSYKV